MIPRLSLHARVALGALAMITLALAVTSYSLISVVSLTFFADFDDRMDIQIHAFEKAISVENTLDTSRLFLVRDLDPPSPDWGWRVQTPAGVWRGGIEISNDTYPDPPVHEVDGARSGDAYTSDGVRLHVRRRVSSYRGGDRVVTIVAPHTVFAYPAAKVGETIAAHIAFLAVILLIVSWMQLRAGLYPLRVLRDQVVRLSAGEALSVGASQPKELTPLANELNALMTQNSASLEAARRHVANLAHAIKTPLASLAVQLDCEDASPESRALVTQVSERIAHHLRRARSAAIGLGGRARCDIADSAADLTQTMRRLFAGRNVKIDNRIAASAVASVDPEDLSEMLGNVLENACRFARSLVNLEMHLDGRVAHIVVSDDGPGIPPDKIPIALRAGERLEETSGGYGFGLVIAKELAELYGGSLTLSPSADLGGLRVTIVVPRKVAQDAPG